MKEIYYVYKSDDGKLGRVVKKSKGLWYGYDEGKWVEMPDLIRIEFDITNFEEIAKEEAEKIIKEQEEKAV